MSDTVLLLFCTCPDMKSAESLAEMLVRERQAACVNIIPGLRSIYRWQDEIAGDDEVLLLIKTTEPCAAELIARIAEEHPYEVPEVIAVPIAAGLEAYLEWVRSCTERQD